MRYMDVGGVSVSKLILGTDSLGSLVDRDTSFLLLDSFFNCGGNCIDTARIYAEWLPDGADASETCIGEWMKSRGCRDRVVLITKGGTSGKGSRYGRLSREELNADLEKSLFFLQTDYIDIYMLHRDDTRRPVSDILETLARYVDSGKVRKIACSNWGSQRIEQADEYAAAHGLPRFICSEIQWSLAESTPEAHGDPTLVCMNPDEYHWYLTNHLPVLAFSSQAKGFFTKYMDTGASAFTNKVLERFGTQQNYERAERVKKISMQTGLSPSAVALAYITGNPLNAAAILGCKNAGHLVDSLTAADVVLDHRTIAYLNTGLEQEP